MTYLMGIAEGLGNVFSFPGILIPVAGTAIAMATSFLPGIGGASIAALLMLATLHWPAEDVLLLFGALTGGATFMGSVTAILFSIPGNASSSVLLLDGHPMARNGLPRTALAAAATASAVGSVFGVLVLCLLLPVLKPMVAQFGPLENLMLGLWGLTTLIAVPTSSRSKALAMAVLGLLLSMVGHDPSSGQPRWSFGSLSLYDGLDMVAVLIGFFTFSEIISWRQRHALTLNARVDAPDDRIAAGMVAVSRHPGLTLRSSVLGTIVGILPGVGGTVAGFIAYGQALQTSKAGPVPFGQGDIRGVIAPEAAVDAKDGGSLVPTIALGLPGSESGVILLTVLLAHGVAPGQWMLTEGLGLTFTLIFALLFSNILTSVIGLLAIPLFARLTNLRIDAIAAPLLLASFLSALHLNGMMSDLYTAILFGVVGYLLRRGGWPIVPLIISFVLGGFIEDNLNLATQLAEADRLDPARPAAWVIAALALASFVWMLTTKRPDQGRSSARKTGPMAAFALAALAAVLWWTVPPAPPSAFPLAAWVSGLAAVILVLIGCRDLREASVRVQGTGDPNRDTLLMFAALPVVIWAFGLPLAMGLFVLGWFQSGRALRLSQIGVAVAAAAVTHLYLDQFAGLLLPEPALFSTVGRHFFSGGQG